MAAVNKQLEKLLAEQMGQRVNGSKTARSLTDESHANAIRSIYNRLYELGYKIVNPENISAEHVAVIVKDWHARGRAKATMRHYRSRLSIFCQRIGKSKNFIKPLKHYLPDVDPKDLVVHSGATTSKSWTELGINVIEKIKEADLVDPTGRFGLMLRLMLAFGLRRKEVLCCKPWKSASLGQSWQVFPNESKGARPRLIPITSNEQLAVMQYVCSKVKPNDRLRWSITPRGKTGTLSWAEGRFHELMKSIGLTKKQSGGTGHGLRHTFCENIAIISQMVPMTLGGSGAEFNKLETDAKREAIAEQMGHSRKNSTNAYYGIYPRNPVCVSKADFACAILAGLHEIGRAGQMKKMPESARKICIQLLVVMSEYEVPLTMSMIYTLWNIHSERHAVECVQPQSDGEIAAAMYTAATKILRLDCKYPSEELA